MRPVARLDTTHEQTAADIVNNVLKKLVSLAVEGAKVIDLCVEGDKLLEQGTGAVYNKSVKGVKVSKGASSSPSPFPAPRGHSPARSSPDTLS